jgi:two-component system, OmpR family, response regulator
MAPPVGERLTTNHHYDVLITDNTMPDVTGLELIKKLRCEDMTLAVILASGTVPAEELIQTPWLQIDALLPKPYSFAQLLNTVGVVLHRSDYPICDHTKPNRQSQPLSVGLRPS